MIGIVAEFNPYHCGHKYLIEQARLLIGDEPIVVCMSGDFVQRGEPAVLDKFLRAKNTDADLIIELPLPWCISSAEAFARGAIGLLEDVGCDKLIFGSECGNVDDLKIKIDNEEIKQYMKINPELSFPSARAKVLNSDILDYPNNILGYEYLKHIKKMTPYTIKRTTIHDGPGSAKDIRKTMVGPDLEREYISRLKFFDKDYFEELPDSEDGVGIRLYNAIGESNSLESIFKSAKTKRITESRIRRLTTCAVLGVKKGMNNGTPTYARVLAFNDVGRNVLKLDNDIKYINNSKDINKLDNNSKAVFALGASAHDFYKLGFHEKNAPIRGEDYRYSPFIVDNAQKLCKHEDVI